uniref:BTB/POZ domain-containing protein At3g05675 n=2 Tax=Anthurium amnicola TaxID=1678845 RepID=A0A1D1YB02_9ARAE
MGSDHLRRGQLYTPPMSNKNKDLRLPIRIGDRATSDVVVRLRTDEGRDDWFYCHSHILTEKSKYFAERLSDDWPTCQILDSRNCVEVYCSELEFNFHVNTIRLLYASDLDTWHGVRNVLGILQVADRLGCHQMARSCVDYLEAVPWDETEEEEILRTIPCLGVTYEQILARLHPVDAAAIAGLFISAMHFTTSSQPAALHEVKHSAQEQLEYLLTEDDDSPLLTDNDGLIKSEVRKCVSDLLSRFDAMVKSLSSAPLDKCFGSYEMQAVLSLLSDLSWVCQILAKMEMMRDIVHHWVESSIQIVNAVERLASDVSKMEAKLKVVEMVLKVLEAIGYGHVILPTSKRLHMVKVWLPFVQRTRPLADPIDPDDENASAVKMDCEMWQSLESAFISILLTLPSGDLAIILSGWLRAEQVRYPDLSEAFEVWCYRSKVAKRRFALSDGTYNFAK